MDGESVLDRLLAAGILETAETADELRLSETFERDVDERRQQFARLGVDDVKDRLRERDGDGHLLDVAEESLDFCALYCVLEDYLPTFSRETLVSVVCVLDQVRSEPPPRGGSPDGFLPIDGRRLPVLLRLQRRAIVYVWREECPPCDAMKERLESIVDSPPEDVALFSVYGPDAGEFLYERYSVEGGPTTLFFVDGTVDARLIGLHYPEVIESEIEKIRRSEGAS